MVQLCFLKQKAAYEMLISDWSTVVCSSDLGIHAWIAPAHRSALPAWHCGRGAEVVGESTELQRLDPVDHRRKLRQVVRRVAAGAIEQGDAEFRRSSCRESACE